MIIDGPDGLEIGDLTTSEGAASMIVPRLPAGEYSVTLQGRRTRPPVLAPAIVTMPSLGEMPSFDVTVNKHVTNPATRLAGNGKLIVPSTGSLPVVTVTVIEAQTEATKEIEFSAVKTAQTELGLAIEAALGMKDLVTISETGEIRKVTVNGVEQANKFSIKIPITYLSGGLTLS